MTLQEAGGAPEHRARRQGRQPDPAIRRQHERLAYRLRRRARGLGSADIEDVVQESFVRALAAGRGPGVDSEAYVMGIACHVLADVLRDRGRTRPAADPWRQASPAAATRPCESSPELIAATVERVRDWVSRQPHAIRSVYRHRMELGESQRKAAAALGLSHQQLRTLEARLHDDLRSALRAARSRRGRTE